MALSGLASLCLFIGEEAEVQVARLSRTRPGVEFLTPWGPLIPLP